MGYLHGGLVDWEVTERWSIHAGGWLRMLLGSRRGCMVAACRDSLVSQSFSVKEEYFCFGSAEVVRSRHAATH